MLGGLRAVLKGARAPVGAVNGLGRSASTPDVLIGGGAYLHGDGQDLPRIDERENAPPGGLTAASTSTQASDNDMNSLREQMRDHMAARFGMAPPDTNPSTEGRPSSKEGRDPRPTSRKEIGSMGIETKLGSTCLVIQLDLDILGPQDFKDLSNGTGTFSVQAGLDKVASALRVQCNGVEVHHRNSTPPEGKRRVEPRLHDPATAPGSPFAWPFSKQDSTGSDKPKGPSHLTSPAALQAFSKKDRGQEEQEVNPSMQEASQGSAAQNPLRTTWPAKDKPKLPLDFRALHSVQGVSKGFGHRRQVYFGHHVHKIPQGLGETSPPGSADTDGLKLTGGSAGSRPSRQPAAGRNSGRGPGVPRPSAGAELQKDAMESNRRTPPGADGSLAVGSLPGIAEHPPMEGSLPGAMPGTLPGTMPGVDGHREGIGIIHFPDSRGSSKLSAGNDPLCYSEESSVHAPSELPTPHAGEVGETPTRMLSSRTDISFDDERPSANPTPTNVQRVKLRQSPSHSEASSVVTVNEALDATLVTVAARSDAPSGTLSSASSFPLSHGLQSPNSHQSRRSSQASSHRSSASRDSGISDDGSGAESETTLELERKNVELQRELQQSLAALDDDVLSSIGTDSRPVTATSRPATGRPVTGGKRPLTSGADRQAAAGAPPRPPGASPPG